MSTQDEQREEGRRHIEQFRAPEAIRKELTDLIIQAGGLVWTREGLSPDKRSLTTIAVLIAQGHLKSPQCCEVAIVLKSPQTYL